MSINERIKDVRKMSGLSQTDFAERLGTTRGVITNLEGDKTSPNEPFIKLICREFNVSDAWLRTGDGEMRQKLTRNQEIAEFMGVVMHDPDDAPRKRFVSIISKLSADEWQLLAEIAKKNDRGRLTVPGHFLPHATSPFKNLHTRSRSASVAHFIILLISSSSHSRVSSISSSISPQKARSFFFHFSACSLPHFDLQYL